MSVTTKIRRQGGAAVVTIPPTVLKMMQVEVGDQLSLAVKNGELVARPLAARKRYKMSELLVGQEIVADLNADLAWAMEGEAVGHEIA